MGIRLENFEGMPGRSERKQESRISPQTEDIAKDSLFFSARMEEVGVMGDRHERMIFTPALISVTQLTYLLSAPLSIGVVGGKILIKSGLRAGFDPFLLGPVANRTCDNQSRGTRSHVGDDSTGYK